MSSPNPYASPETPRETDRDERFLRRFLPLLIGGLLAGCVFSFFYPLYGVPLTLFAMPSLLRGTRIYWRRQQAAELVSVADWGLLVFVSLFAVIPISIVGLVAFCCVCTPAGYVAFSVSYPMESSPFGSTLFYAAIYLGLAAGLLASLLLLKRLRYLSVEEREALDKAESPDSPSPEPLNGDS